MKNTALKIQCSTLISSIQVFKQCIYQACLENDGTICKKEEKFMQKLNKQIDTLVKTLEESP